MWPPFNHGATHETARHAIPSQSDQPRADRLTRSKLVYRVAEDAMLLSDDDEAARLIELWRELQWPEGRLT